MIALQDPRRAEELFRGRTDTIVWSCLSGRMGTIYADRETAPSAAAACLGDFCLFGGEPNEALVRGCPAPEKEFQILVPDGGRWEALIEACWKEKLQRITRYAFKKEPDVWDLERLRQMTEQIPEGFELRKIDRELFGRARGEAWCRDWTAQFEDYGQYRRYGAGMAILKDGRLVSGASAYSAWPGGIEVEIDTHPGFRRRGLARGCAAALILECVKRGLYPSWDAHTPASAALARALGYRPEREYTAYELRLCAKDKEEGFTAPSY